MKGQKYLALDFGAESGRAILGVLNDSGLELEEIHRFVNPQVQVLDHIYWDVLSLFQELKNALSRASKKGHRVLQGIGVDTWGVDFGIIGKGGALLGNPVAYRDKRTDGMMEKAVEKTAKKKSKKSSKKSPKRKYTSIPVSSLSSSIHCINWPVSHNPIVNCLKSVSIFFSCRISSTTS